MISPEIAQLMIEIAGMIYEREKREVEADPELCLAALLIRIKEELPRRSSGMRRLVEWSFFRSYQAQARQLLRREQS